jgi:hypothetical protein
MPPKKRTRSATKGDSTGSAAAAPINSEDEVDAPAAKKTRATRGSVASKSAATKAKSIKTSASKKADTPEVSDDADDAPATKQSQTNGKLAASSSSKTKAVPVKPPKKVSSKKGKGKKVADDSQDAGADANADVEDDQNSSTSVGLPKKPVKDSTKDAQVTKTDNLVVPVDEHSPLQCQCCPFRQLVSYHEPCSCPITSFKCFVGWLCYLLKTDNSS